MLMGTQLIGFGTGKLETVQTIVAQATGTAIGNMSSGGGLSAAFDSSDSQASGAGAAVLAGGIGYIGKDWGTTKEISGFVVYPSNDSGFCSGSPNVTIALIGHTANDPASGTNLGSITVGDNTISRSKLTGITLASYQYHWLKITNDGGQGDAYVAEVYFYEEL